MIAGILLAAGQSTRFGGRKLLHPLADGTPLVLAALHALQSGVDQVTVVTQPNDTALLQLLQQEPVAVVPCDHASGGMGASLACGVRATPDAQGWLIALGDMPLVPISAITAIADRLRAGAHIVAPVCAGRRGHPVGFSHAFFDELSRLDGDVGARHVIDAHEAQLTLLPCDDPGIFHDINTVADLNASTGG